MAMIRADKEFIGAVSLERGAAVTALSYGRFGPYGCVRVSGVGYRTYIIFANGVIYEYIIICTSRLIFAQAD